MKNTAEQILDAVVWITNHVDGGYLKEAPVLELAKKLSLSPTELPRLRILLRELQPALRRKPAVLSHWKRTQLRRAIR